VTQVLAAITPEYAFVVADRRTTYVEGRRRGTVASEQECKLVSLCHVSAIGYTGYSELQGIPTHEWIATTLAKSNCHHAHEASKVLAESTNAALPPASAQLRRHAFLLCGWAPFEPDRLVKPHMCLISNYHDEAMLPTANAREDFRVNVRTLRLSESVAVFSVGEPLRPGREVSLTRSIRRALAHENDPASTLRLLVEEVFTTSDRTSTVGDRVQACCIPIASAYNLFTSGRSRLSGLRPRADRTTFSYYDREYNEYTQHGPTTTCGQSAFADLKYERSTSGPEQSAQMRVLHAPPREP